MQIISNKLRLLPFLLLAPALSAHTVTWDPNPMVLTFDAKSGVGSAGTVSVSPFTGETCLVNVQGNRKIQTPPVVAFALAAGQANPAVQVKLVVTALSLGTTQVSVFWNATGLDSSGQNNPDCAGQGNTTIDVTVVAPKSNSTSGQNVNSGQVSEPISTSTGELFGYDDRADFHLDGPLPLEFRRYYASYLSSGSISSALGANWMHNFDISLAVTASTAKVTLFRGKSVTFQQSGGAWQLSSTEQRPFQFIAAGTGYQFLDPRSNLTYSFNATGALTAIQDRNGNTLTVTPGPAGPAQVSDSLGRTLSFTYTGSTLTKVQDQAGRAVTFEYTGGLLTAWTDANGKRSVFAYTSAGGLNGLMTSETRAAGNQPMTQLYDSLGRVSTQSFAVGNPLSFTYNSGKNGAQFTVPSGPSFTDAHDSNFNITSHTDANGVASTFTYDANNRILTSTDRTGARESLTYDSASGLPATYTDPLGNKSVYLYSATTAGGFTFYDLIGATFADGTSMRYKLDGKGNVIARTDQAGNTWQATYNSNGQITTATNPSGAVTTSTYGSDGTLTSVQLPSGDSTGLAYDAAKRPTLLTNPDGTTRASKFDGLDHVTGSTDERNNSAGAAFDANGNLHTRTDALNALTSLTYDGDDRLTSTTDALGHATTRVYDGAGRLQSITDATGVAINRVYDALNRPNQVLDSAGKGSTLVWDQEARLTGITDALSRTTSLTRDARGLTTGFKTPKNETTSFAYDVLRRPTSSTDPLGRVTSYAYDSRGLISVEKLPGGVAAAYTFNELGLLTGIADPTGNAWSSAYDKQGRLVSRTDPLGQTTSLQYDSRQRVSTVTFPAGSLQNSYDAAGNPTGRSYSDGTKLTYTYDADNRLTGADGLTLTYDANGRILTSNGLKIGRDSAGRMASVTYAPGKTVQYTYDNRGLLTQVADWAGGTTVFTYDAAHQLISRTFANGVAETFAWDADGRVTSIQTSRNSAAISSISLVRDAVGRVVSATRSAASVPDVPTGYLGLAYDAASQNLGSTYDPLGRLTQDAVTGRTYNWDLASRLRSYAGPNGTASFTYDAFGQRVSRTESGLTQNYVLNYALPLPSVSTVQSGGADARYYVWLPNGTLLESIEAAGNTRHFYHFDESGTTNFLTGDTGTVTDSYASSPYGEDIVQTGSTPNPFTFQGAYGVMQEGATGLYYMRARYYDSTAARFISRDPVVQNDPRALSPYQFALANPIEGSDATGRLPKDLDEYEGRPINYRNVEIYGKHESVLFGHLFVYADSRFIFGGLEPPVDEPRPVQQSATVTAAVSVGDGWIDPQPISALALSSSNLQSLDWNPSADSSGTSAISSVDLQAVNWNAAPDPSGISFNPNTSDLISDVGYELIYRYEHTFGDQAPTSGSGQTKGKPPATTRSISPGAVPQ